MTDPDQRRAPALLVGAAGLVGLEGLFLAVMAVLELLALHSGRVTLGLTTAAFFLALGAGLGFCAVGLFRVHSWARGPVAFCQLLGLLLATSFWGGSTKAAAVVMFVVSLAVLVGVLHPASTRALAASEQ